MARSKRKPIVPDDRLPEDQLLPLWRREQFDRRLREGMAALRAAHAAQDAARAARRRRHPLGFGKR